MTIPILTGLRCCGGTSSHWLGPLIQRRFAAQLISVAAVNTYPTKTPLLEKSPEASHRRRPLLRRTGLLGQKQGMVPWYDSNGTCYPCTVVQIDRVQVTHVKTKDVDGYYAVQLGYGAKTPAKVTRQLLGHYARAQVSPKAEVVEFQVKNSDGLLPLGTELKADHFIEGQYVDIKSRSKGKGFQGVMKRHGFSGLPASHGASLSHRSAGSTGMNQTPGRVLPGKKMPGRMGAQNVTIQNSKIVKVDVENGIILVKGPVSGANGTYVKISDAIKKSLPSELLTI